MASEAGGDAAANGSAGLPVRRPWVQSDSGASMASESAVPVFDGRAVFGEAPGAAAELSAALAKWIPEIPPIDEEERPKGVSDNESILGLSALREALDEAIPMGDSESLCSAASSRRTHSLEDSPRRFDLLSMSLRSRNTSAGTIRSNTTSHSTIRPADQSERSASSVRDALESCAASLATDSDGDQSEGAVRYADVFCGEDGRGFRVLVQRMRYGRRATEALLSYVGLRIEMEEEYGRRLHRVSSHSFPRQDAFLAAGSAWDNAIGGLCVSSGELAQTHAGLCETLRERVLRPLEQSLRVQSRTKAQHKEEMQRLVRARAAAADASGRKRERLARQAAEVKRLLSIVPDGPRAAARHAEALVNAEDGERALSAEAAVADARLLELEGHCYAAMRKAATDLEAADRSRLEATRSALLAYAGAMSNVASTDSAHYRNMGGRHSALDVGGDMAAFARNGVRRAKVLHSFTPRRRDEIAISAGETVSVEDTGLHPWWRGTNAAGARGLYPSNYVEPL